MIADGVLLGWPLRSAANPDDANLEVISFGRPLATTRRLRLWPANFLGGGTKIAVSQALAYGRIPAGTRHAVTGLVTQIIWKTSKRHEWSASWGARLAVQRRRPGRAVRQKRHFNLTRNAADPALALSGTPATPPKARPGNRYLLIVSGAGTSPRAPGKRGS